MQTLEIVLVEPETAGNVGAVARAMQNFGFKKLHIINPKCDVLGKEAMDRATHAKSILNAAKIHKNLDFLKKFQTVAATTARIGTDYNIKRTPFLPRELDKRMSGRCAILFGRESSGLKNEELAKCDFAVTIPTDGNSSLNISHAAVIVLYELNHQKSSEALKEGFPLATAREKQELLKLIDKKLDRMTFPTNDKRETQKIVWRHVLGKSSLTKREAFALLGFFKKA